MDYGEADAQRTILLQSLDSGVTWVPVEDPSSGSSSSGGGGDVIIFKNDVYQAVRSALNLIEGANVTITVADDSANNQVDVTIASTGGGGGGSALTVREDAADVDAAVTHLEFEADDFDLTEPVDHEVRIVISAAIARQADLTAHIGDVADAHDASAISADSTTLVGTATDVQGVLEEIDNAIADHLADATGAHAATAISVDSTNLTGTAIEVQGSLEELDNTIDAHIADATAAHAATAIAFTPAGSIAADDVQEAVEEVASEAATALSNHLGDTSDAHDASAISVDSTTLVGTGTDVQAVFEEVDNDIVALKAPDYLVGTATGTLAGEIAVGTTPGGDLGNTWASPTVDGLQGVALTAGTPTFGHTYVHDGTNFKRAGVLAWHNSGQTATIHTTTTETSILGGNQTIPAGSLKVNDWYEINWFGYIYNFSGSSGTFTINPYINSSLGGLGMVTASLPSGALNAYNLALRYFISPTTVGAGGIFGAGFKYDRSAANSVAGADYQITGTQGLSADTTAAVTFDIRVVHSINNANFQTVTRMWTIQRGTKT